MHERDIPPRLLKQIAQVIWELMVERELHSDGEVVWRVTNKPIPWVLSESGKTLVNSGSAVLREAVCPQRINRLAALKRTDDIVDSNPVAFYCEVPTPHAR